MRVLHISDAYNGSGGVETYLKGVVRELRSEREHEDSVYVFSFDEKIVADNETANELVVKKKGNLLQRTFSAYFFDLPTYFKLKRFVKKVNPDLIHIHHNYKAPNAVLMALRGIKAPVIQTVHDYTLLCPKGTFMQNGKPYEGTHLCLRCLPLHWYILSVLTVPFRNRLIKRKVKLFLSPSKTLKHYMEKNGFRNVEHLPYFIDLSKWKQRREKESNSSRRRKNVLFVGRLRPEKGCSYLIKAMVSVVKQFPTATLTIIGDGSERERLRQLTQQLQIGENVMFAGEVENDKIQKHFYWVDVLVVPSVWMEQFGIVGLEAMAAGIPSVGSNIGGIPEWLEDGKNGYLTNTGDSAEIAEKIIALLRSPAAAKKMGEYGKNKIKQYDIKLHMKRLEEIYKRMLTKSF